MGEAETIIEVENLGKKYIISHSDAKPNATLRDALTNGMRALGRRLRRPWRRPPGETREEFWALKDVAFEIKRGQVVGIIGRNGAGKSTLLKILSRITEPTTGRVILDGRVASLLEVGTGFHPELSGRENVFLNGAILGMSRAEIRRKFDEIVAFAEVEKFIDTPVKHYSSGMYTRLAFAVAAHLEPEILVVDEVLAVGDAAFQSRCLRKMNEVSRSGRTILFVSHNLASIKTLCHQVAILHSGRLVSFGDATGQVAAYLAGLAKDADLCLEDRSDREGSGLARLVDLRMVDTRDQKVDHFLAGTEVHLELDYHVKPGAQVEKAALSFWTMEGEKIFHVDTELRGTLLNAAGDHGTLICRLPRLLLVPGTYYINALLNAGGACADHVYAAGKMKVLPGDVYGTGKPTPVCGGVVFVDHEWEQVDI